MGRIAEALMKAGQVSVTRVSDLGSHGITAGGLSAIRTPSELNTSFGDPSAERDANLAKTPIELPEKIDPALLAVTDKGSYVSEQYRAIRTWLHSQNLGLDHWVIGITSSSPREGKSITALNLGLILAEMSTLKTCVVDADLRRGRLAEMLGLSDSPGFGDVLRGEAELNEAVQKTFLPNLHFLSAGSVDSYNPAELLSSDRPAKVLRQIQARYHYTIVDTPPTNSVSDAFVLGQLCNGVVIVIRMNQTTEPDAQHAIRLLQSSNINVMGCILAGNAESDDLCKRKYGDYYSRSNPEIHNARVG
jgi:capsular exopolysaccharide synthesis family protein